MNEGDASRAAEEHRLRMQRRKARIDARVAAATEDRGVILVLTGSGKGKSSSAFGMLARALGHDMRVGIVQFIKGTFSTGEEYQLLDDKNVPAEYVANLSHKAAAMFGVVPNTSNTIPKSGEWNHSRILQQNGAVSFWLNDVLTVQVDLKSESWKSLVAASSLSKYPEFGVAVNGHLALQDWTNGVAFRNIKVRELGPRAAGAPDPAKSQAALDSMERSVPGAETQKFTDTIQLQANENMRFDKELFKVHTGKKITLILENTSPPANTSMSHNVVILKPDIDLADFADVARNAQNEQYVPSSVSSLVIAHTKLVPGGQSDQVEFAISEPGVYPFICSFPGHWGTMQGKVVAE